ncbi:MULTISPECIES: universal stress protein [Vibrio]|uniref:Universal stress protein family protein n=1 Tax=Vibrio diazotrophicus TaxID=685 RepID=A0A329E6N0_VIBDI|nr:universal stress protein [Vibrio diazotrophicus]PNH82048.1 universal stress protein [Vibrio diazotrophicus]PNH91733.1 universal stress protein [Vibrio diazotrophicus]RAS61024.1 universal stress protein family protein [Vibrio diazotrophicus]
MSVKSIIMPFASKEDGEQRLEGALNVARFFDAHLDVLHAQVGTEKLMPSEKLLVTRKFYDQIDKLVRDYVHDDMVQAKQSFERLCALLNIGDEVVGSNKSSAKWHDIFGYRGEIVAVWGKVSDLIIIPQSLNGQTSVSFEAAVNHGGKPILVMPRKQTFFNPETIMIAWNGDKPGANAVNSALPLLKKAKQVVVVTSEKYLPKQPTQVDLARYLSRHNIDVECITFTHKSRNTGSQLLEVASEINADVIVSGAFAHQKIHQKVFGGVTQKLLMRSNIPLWMMS